MLTASFSSRCPGLYGIYVTVQEVIPVFTCKLSAHNKKETNLPNLALADVLVCVLSM
jgi:hypothetical protein